MSEDSNKDLSLWQVMGSVLASFLGVQKQANRERDFARGRPSQFIIVGLLFTAIFVALVWGVVSLVMHFATR